VLLAAPPVFAASQKGRVYAVRWERGDVSAERCTAMTDKASSACAGTYHRVNCSRRSLAHFLSP